MATPDELKDAVLVLLRTQGSLEDTWEFASHRSIDHQVSFSREG
jgi:hypothetical protein